MRDDELIKSEITEELEAGSFTVKQRSFIEEYLKCLNGSEKPDNGTKFCEPDKTLTFCIPHARTRARVRFCQR